LALLSDLEKEPSQKGPKRRKKGAEIFKRDGASRRRLSVLHISLKKKKGGGETGGEKNKRENECSVKYKRGGGDRFEAPYNTTSFMWGANGKLAF